MLKKKPVLAAGQDVRSLPTYTIPEAAAFLAIEPFTLQSWYSDVHPVLCASGTYGKEAFALLSFRDLQEAYKVHLLRTKFDYSMQYLRKALVDAREISGSDHPLLTHKMVAFERLALEMPDGSGRVMHPLASNEKAFYIPDVVDAWGKRIIDEKDRSQIFPWRLARNDDDSRPVSLDPEVLSGRLVVTGTRIPARVLVQRAEKGDSPEEIANDYGLKLEVVRKALIHLNAKIS